MNIKSVLMILTVGILLIQCGCGSEGAARAGFLSDYSRLQTESSTSLRYINTRVLAKYSSFIVDPVRVHFHSGSKSKGKLTMQQINDLTSYMHANIISAVMDSGNKVVYKPAPGVARVRIALTDIEKTNAVNILPQASLLGVGLGGASMEGEVIDSMTGEQIGAVVESQKGSRIPFSNLGEWSTSKKIMDDWAKRFRQRLTEAR
ncbi:MAG: DUF3313 domain-containing protein [Planctomycetes bacterium]|nr:DUF3313 domain-containing protein [Planctomycetota bacterium]